MYYSLLLSLASATFISTLIGGEGGQMMKSVFLDVHFDIDSILSGVVLEYFVKKCVKSNFYPVPILFFIKCLTNTIQPDILVLKLFSTRIQFS